MSLTFDPAIGSVTTLPVYATGNTRLRFTASFASRDAFQRAKRGGTRVEMYTNLPVGATNGEWHALPFQYSDENSTTAYLDLELTPTTADARFSFTYRLVHARGAIQWLGEYGRDGVLDIEHQEDRFSPVEGCKLDGDRVVCVSGTSTSTTVAKLNLSLDWVCWYFTREGWAFYSPDTYAADSAAVFLIPRAPQGGHRLLVHRALFLSADEEGSHVSIDKNGAVSLFKAASLSILDTSSSDLEAQLQSKLSMFSTKLMPEGFIAFMSEYKEESSVAISVVPLSYSASPEGVRFRYEDLAASYPQLCGNDMTVVNITSYGYHEVIKADSCEDVAATIDPCGSQLIVAPYHTLPQIGEAIPWGLALLSPSTSAKIETSPSAEALAHAFPTPPPSPPPMHSASFNSASFHSLSTSVGSMPSISETLEEEDDPSVEEAREEVAEEEVVEAVEVVEEQEEETIVAHDEMAGHVVLHRTPVRGGLLRFLFAWLLRALVTRVFGLFGARARELGMSLFGFASETESNDAAQKSEKRVTVEDENDEKVGTDEEREEHRAIEDSTADISLAESEHTIESASDSTLATLADDEINDKTPLAPVKALPAEPVLAQPTPTHIPSLKSRFLADVNSNTVSLLVRAPHSRLSPAALHITVDGKRVSESQEGYSCARLADDVYLVGVQGPEGGAHVEITVD